MKSQRWKLVNSNLRETLIFLFRYILISALLTLISGLVLFMLFVDQNNSELGRIADALIPLVLGPVIGMTLGLLVMYVYDRAFS